MKISGILTVLFLGAAWIGCKIPAVAGENKQMNVLFITVDDLRPNLGCYGDNRAITPHIDRLAENGTVFNYAYCQQAVCNPSRASVLTGLRPDEIGVNDLVTHFRHKIPDAVTLPQVFMDAGYQAVNVGKIFHGTKETQDDISWSIPPMYNISSKEEEYFLPENKIGGKAASFEIADVEDYEYADGKISEEAIRLLNHFKSTEEKFFLAVGFKKPHLPFSTPQKYWDMYTNTDFTFIADRDKPENAPEIAFHQWQELRGYKDIPNHGTLSSDKEQQLWRSYFACISYVDFQIGKLINELERLGLTKNTLIVLWGDHGFHLGEQDLWCKSTNFELDVRIPLIICAPGHTSGASCQALVEAVDIFPTIVELCNVNHKRKLSGRSLLPLLKDPAEKWNHYAYSQFVRPYKALNSKNATHMGYSVRTPDWRYTMWFNLTTDSVEFRELYNLDKYHVENENLSGIQEFSKTEVKLSRILNNYRNNK